MSLGFVAWCTDISLGVRHIFCGKVVKWTKVTVTGNGWNLFGKHITQNDIHLLVNNLQNPPNSFQPVVEKEKWRKKITGWVFWGGWKFSETPLRYVTWRQVISKFQKWRHWEPATSSISRPLEYPARQRKEIGTILGLRTASKNPHQLYQSSSHITKRSNGSTTYPQYQITQTPNPTHSTRQGAFLTFNQPGSISDTNRVTQTYPTNASELTQHFATRSLEPSNWMSSNDSKASVLRPTQGPERNASSSLC